MFALVFSNVACCLFYLFALSCTRRVGCIKHKQRIAMDAEEKKEASGVSKWLVAEHSKLCQYVPCTIVESLRSCELREMSSSSVFSFLFRCGKPASTERRTTTTTKNLRMCCGDLSHRLVNMADTCPCVFSYPIVSCHCLHRDSFRLYPHTRTQNSPIRDTHAKEIS